MDQEQLYKQAEYIVKRFWKSNRKHFLNIAMEYEDVVQEAIIVVLEVMNKYHKKSWTELKKIVNMSVGNHMLNILKHSFIEQKYVVSPQENEEFDIENLKDNLKEDS